MPLPLLPLESVANLQPGSRGQTCALLGPPSRPTATPGARQRVLRDATTEITVLYGVDAGSPMEGAPGTLTVLTVERRSVDGRPSLHVLEARGASDRDTIDPDTLYGSIPPCLSGLADGPVGFDVETTSRFGIDQLPPRERAKLERRAREEAAREAAEATADPIATVAAVQRALALNPLTNRVVSVAFHHLYTGAECALVVAPAEDLSPPAFGMDEPALLRAFWTIAPRVALVGYNSTRFDVPVLRLRSLLLGVRPTVDLTDRRGVGSRHIDVFEQLGERVSLELACFAFGIPAKQSGHGSEVSSLFQAGRFQELASYNIEDARVTALLYERLTGV